MSNAGAPRRGSVQNLVGRRKELELVRSFVMRAAAEGAALLVTGEPGVGKSVLLDAAADAAASADSRILRASGEEFEPSVSFAGLTRVLEPLQGDLGGLGAAHRQALGAALGSGDGPALEELVVANAALMLLRLAAAASPLLVIVDDLPWLDRASAQVLAFIARRLDGSRVGFLAAARSGEQGFFDRAGLPGYELQPLDDDAAAVLLDASFPDLAPRVRRRLLAKARGNPLALIELPTALSGPQRSALDELPAVLPLSQRLQAIYASRVRDLPTATRQLLLLAAMDGTGDLRILHAAAAPGPGLDDLAPAERARLVYVDARTRMLAFRHPLTRSAVVGLSTPDERRRAHRALAGQLADQPDRQAWHLAEAAVGPDEQVAGLLARVAHQLLRRGDAVAAVAMLVRAADLSLDRSARARRLAEVAYLGAGMTGELLRASPLLAAARQADPDLSGSLPAAIAAVFLLLNGDGDIATAHRLLVGVIEGWEGRQQAGDHLLGDALSALFLVCWFGGRAELWPPYQAAIARFRSDVPDHYYLLSQTVPDPVRTAAPVFDRLHAAVLDLRDEADHMRILQVAAAALYADRQADCREPLWRVIQAGREGGAVSFTLTALTHLSLDDFMTGRWDEAQQLADEALELCSGHSYRLQEWTIWRGQALLAAARGDQDTVRILTDKISRWAGPRGVAQAQVAVHHVCSLAALGRSDFEEAYRHASAISPAGVFASHAPCALWVLMDLVEAAVRTGRQAEAAAHVGAMRAANVAAISPRIALLAADAAAIAAPADGGARELFQNALAQPSAPSWPFDLARVELAYGEHLRRARATAESRRHLGMARDAFERLGAKPWAARARRELRATGQAVAAGGEPGTASLTPQERYIAHLAAVGLTNKQIAERLFMSHRTVGAYLYQIFPKLGITSRAGLRDALAALPAEQQDEPMQPPPQSRL